MSMNPRVRRLAIAIVLMAASLRGGRAARAAGALWYNGDSDGRDGYVNQTGSPDGYVYDNFVVPAGQSWTITSVYSNDLLAVNPTTAHWEIRSGVSAGVGGTLLDSGDGADSLQATGKSYNFNNVGTLLEYTNTVAVTGVTLGPGTYWLAVVPDTSGLSGNPGTAATLIDTTSGTHAVGNPPGDDGNSYMSSTFFGLSFVPLLTIEGDTSQNWDVSMGVNGTVTQLATPEPASIVTGLTGLFLAGGYVRMRSRKAAKPTRSMPN